MCGNNSSINHLKGIYEYIDCASPEERLNILLHLLQLVTGTVDDHVNMDNIHVKTSNETEQVNQAQPQHASSQQPITSSSSQQPHLTPQALSPCSNSPTTECSSDERDSIPYNTTSPTMSGNQTITHKKENRVHNHVKLHTTTKSTVQQYMTCKFLKEPFVVDTVETMKGKFNVASEHVKRKRGRPKKYKND